ncbi:putative 6-phosphogluconolactonase [Fulvia fulva]|uniref:6-phosphogluconolactonase n=1 Tax=Passalora fulva TaxID=5499 RepID=A0A9Q8PM08_PASFU|nr:putative 6-phosphogluconolactonase [Fulvia fulva]KAK4609023.1 putative 6-phosphogluconolactonase [Fulvia fulva]UJO24847.1 putative 6-phosphogluconolactonase [Fulvia fulva]WPV22962.1 putative 6-phosphogluconolactonase [Fulvia fulva]WPV37441.1 putative 6-phosphogluconolactonase [Fulvia fulva]
MLSTNLLALCATTASAATNLFVADYSGNVTTLSLSETNGTYKLEQTSINDGCAPNPSWLTIDPARGVLYCLNEGLSSPNGSLSSFTINADGSLEHVQNTTTANGPVSGIIYGEPAGQRALALAHYRGSAVSSWLLTEGGNFAENGAHFFTLHQPGPHPDRQAAPYEHEAITDPTGQYIVVPDLGADLVRVFGWNAETLELEALQPLKLTPGTGPRHAAFYTPYGVPRGTTHMYLVGELTGTVTAYSVAYLPGNSGLSFTELSNTSTIPLFTPHRRNAPAEIHVSPDNRFLIISNRNDSSFTLPDPIGESDSISTFALDHDGSITFTQLWPAAGLFPRHYETNAIGNLVAVGLQNSQAVAILARDVQTGLIGEPVARIEIGGNVTAVVWDEERALGVLGG